MPKSVRLAPNGALCRSAWIVSCVRAHGILVVVPGADMSLTNEDKEWITSTIASAISAEMQKTLEAMRDMQTEILRGIEAFSRGNFARMHRLEVSDSATNERISALEERVLRLETRRGA